MSKDIYMIAGYGIAISKSEYDEICTPKLCDDFYQYNEVYTSIAPSTVVFFAEKYCRKVKNGAGCINLKSLEELKDAFIEAQCIRDILNEARKAANLPVKRDLVGLYSVKNLLIQNMP